MAKLIKGCRLLQLSPARDGERGAWMRRVQWLYKINAASLCKFVNKYVSLFLCSQCHCPHLPSDWPPT